MVILRAIRVAFPVLLAQLPLFLLSFGLGGVIALAAADPACANLSLGTFGELLDPWVLRLKTLGGLMIYCCFYLVVGVLLAVAGSPLALRKVQRMFLQPIFTPVLFQIAGLVGGTGAAQINSGNYQPLLFSVVTIFFALLSHHAYEIFRA